MIYLKRYISDKSWINEKIKKYYEDKWKNSEILKQNTNNNEILIYKYPNRKNEKKNSKTDVSINLKRYISDTSRKKNDKTHKYYEDKWKNS